MVSLGNVGIGGFAASAGTSVVRVAPTFCTPVTLRMVLANVLDDECATITPIASYDA